LLDLDVPVGAGESLHRHHRVATVWQHGSGHDLDAVFGGIQGARRIAGSLCALQPEAATAGGRSAGGEGDAIHGDPVEGRVVALRIDILAQYGTAALTDRQRLDRHARQVFGNQLFGGLGIQHRCYVSAVACGWCDAQVRATIRVRCARSSAG
jgi:L-alanine-DL-glutamate epimerase-like enolase superfamily enzyme